ncbi:muscarinic acetylcholine receptor M5-like [Anneissia japonica]|uniref:muscarinic acetylcholine receptor M5-like n=1 Tax=Anneissia japonica TaxID=1529436 RepID=UPI0014258735|nr:muscarinic acetylcholine receptor M5-like [Anneissia japonica]
MDSMGEFYTVMNTDTEFVEICAFNDSDANVMSSMSSSIVDCHGEPENDWLFLFGMVTVWVFTAMSIYGNCLVLISFAINQNIRSKPANVFIFTLSLADLTVGVVSLPPNNIWVQYGYWPFGETFCKIYLFIDFTACAVSSGCIILLSLDRYWMVKKHLKYNSFMTHRKGFVLSLCVVSFYIIFFSLSIFFWEAITGESRIDYSVDCEVEGVDNVIFGSLSITLEFIIPFSFLVYLNINVYIEIMNWSTGKNLQRAKNYKIKRKKTKNISKMETSQENFSSNQKSETSVIKANNRDSFRRFQGSRSGSQTRKAAIMLAVLVTVFVICWTPYNIFVMIDNSEISDFVWECVNYLLWFNSGINPILYAVTNDQFRQTFARIMFCRWSEKKNGKYPHTNHSQQQISQKSTITRVP